MKGLAQAVILAEIERRAGKPLSKCVDIVAGTSIGGISASFVASDYPMAKVPNVFLKSGSKIFHKEWWRPYLVHGSKYNPAGLVSELKLILGEWKLSDCTTKLLVPAFDLMTKKPHFFKSYEHNDQHGDCLLWKVGRSTSAAEIYFPAFELDGMLLWDGGNIANNPAVCVFADCVKIWGPDVDVDFLVVNCASDNSPYNLKNFQRAGVFRTFPIMLDVLFEAGSEDVDYQMPYFTSKYTSITPTTNWNIGLDSTDDRSLVELVRAGTAAVAANGSLIDDFLS